MINIIKATEKDFENYNQLDKILIDMHKDIIHNNQLLSEESEKQIYKNILNDSSTELYILRYQNIVKGMFKIRFLTKESKCVINQIVTNSPRHGYGQVMLDYIINRAKEKHIKYVRLKVYNFNKNAIKFYKKNGFIIVDKDVESQIMSKTLTK